MLDSVTHEAREVTLGFHCFACAAPCLKLLPPQEQATLRATLSDSELVHSNRFLPMSMKPTSGGSWKTLTEREKVEAKPRTSARPQLPFCARHLRELLNAKWMLPWDTDFTEIPSWKQFPPCTCYLQVSRVCSFAVFVVLFIFTIFSSPPPPLQGDDGEQESTTQRVP